jgi:hypothetical protein
MEKLLSVAVLASNPDRNRMEHETMTRYTVRAAEVEGHSATLALHGP